MNIFVPVLKVSGTGGPLVPEESTGEALLENSKDGDLVRIEAKLVDRIVTVREQILIAESGRAILEAQLQDAAGFPFFRR